MSRMPDVFISLRFAEALDQGKRLKAELETIGLSVFLCAADAGDDLADVIAENLVKSKLVVILGTATYGFKTSSSYSTYNELEYVTSANKPFFLVKMCSEFTVPFAQVHCTGPF